MLNHIIFPKYYWDKKEEEKNCYQLYNFLNIVKKLIIKIKSQPKKKKNIYIYMTIKIKIKIGQYSLSKKITQRTG